MEKTFSLDDFVERCLRPTTLNAIRMGRLDYAIQSDDCQDIIDGDPKLREAVDKRLEIIKCSKKQ
jgi:hypothetical protein